MSQAKGKETVSFSAMSNMAGNLPSNARYVTHKNECYDWGTLGWLLTTKRVSAGTYASVLAHWPTCGLQG